MNETSCQLPTFFLVAVAGAVLAAAQNAAVTRGSAVVNGTTLDYDVTGNGPPVVLIGGGGTLDRRAWDEQVAALSPQYTVLRYDVRGIGGSARAVGPFSHGEDLHALLQSLSLLPAYVAGLSFGAGIAVDLALDHPGAVRGLVLAAPGLSSDKDQNLEGALTVADLVRGNGLEPVVDAMVANPTLLATASASVRERVRTLYMDNGDVFVSDFALVRLWRPTDPPARERLSSIRVPTIVLVGDRDSDQVRSTADLLATRIGGATRTDLAGAGHLLNLDAPEPFNRAVLDFLAR